MKTKFNGTSVGIKKLRALQNSFNAILAGGALRDDYFGRFDEISDYDYFIHGTTAALVSDSNVFSNYVTQVIERVFPAADNIEELYDSTYMTISEQNDTMVELKPGPNDQLCGIWEIDEEDMVYQLIFTKKDPIVYVNTHFDIGLCKTYCDGKKIRYTQDFMHDANNKTLTIVGEGMTKEQVEYSLSHHADKLLWKYDDHRIVVPEKYQKYVAHLGFPSV